MGDNSCSGDIVDPVAIKPSRIKSVAWRTILIGEGRYFLSQGGILLKKQCDSREVVYELTNDLYFGDRYWERINGYSPQRFAIYMQSYKGRPTGYYKLEMARGVEYFYCRFAGGGGL